MREYLNFEKLITPTLVRVLFWLAIVVIIFDGIGEMFGGAFWRGILILLVGPLFACIYCEVVIVIFQINNSLTEIRDGQQEAAARQTAVPPIPPAI